MKIDKRLLQYCLYTTVTVLSIYIGIAMYLLKPCVNIVQNFLEKKEILKNKLLEN